MKGYGGMREGGARSERARRRRNGSCGWSITPPANIRLKPNTRNLGAKGGRRMSLWETQIGRKMKKMKI